jgi:hypothetical protein
MNQMCSAFIKIYENTKLTGYKNDLLYCFLQIIKYAIDCGELYYSVTLSSLEKLMDAKLVSYRDRSWKIRELRDVFSLTKLIAVEAKLNEINKVVEQTHLNTRFASHSYALTNSAHPQGETVKTFKRFGIGLYGKDSQFRRIVEAKQYTLPSSYLSFQFNEWIGNFIAHQGGIQNA